jgi:osmotically-inducible protein OsmY
MMDDILVRAVEDELAWDPKVRSEAVAVSADDGAVTLRGTVGSLREKRAAKKAAERVRGVIEVENELEVLPFMTDGDRDDAALRGDVLQALALHGAIPSTVGADVYDGHVALSGQVQWHYEREEAESVAANVPGVVDVENAIRLSRSADDAARDVSHAIRSAFKRDAKLDANGLTVAASDGLITVEGTVRSWSEHDSAIAAAWAAPGVRYVDDKILVAY